MILLSQIFIPSSIIQRIIEENGIIMNADFMRGAGLAAEEAEFMHGAQDTQTAQTPGFMHGLNLLANAANVTPALRERQGDIAGNAVENGGLAAAPHFPTNRGTEEPNQHGRNLFPNTPAAYTPATGDFHGGNNPTN